MSDVQLAAEALQSLRASSASSSPTLASSELPKVLDKTTTPSLSSSLLPPLDAVSSNNNPVSLPQLGTSDSQSIRLPPIQTQSDSFYSSNISNINKPSKTPFNSLNHHSVSPVESCSSHIPSVPGTPSAYLRNLDSNPIDKFEFQSPLGSPTSNIASPNINSSSSPAVIIDSTLSGTESQNPNPSSNKPPVLKKRKQTSSTGFFNPIVSSAAKIYQQSKSYSPRFKYSAEKLESAISYRMTNTNSNENINNNKVNTNINISSTSGNLNSINNSPSLLPSLTLSPDKPFNSDMALHTSQSPTMLPPISSLNPQPSSPTTQQQQSIANPKKRQRSTWHGVLVTASSIATSLSYENKQRLRYCLHLLKLANTHIAAKVNQLQELLNEERAAVMAQSIAANHTPNESGVNNSSNRSGNGNSNFNNKTYQNHFLGQKVNTIKRDIVWTIRKVISALSTYAGNSLPEPARSHVRSYILQLPARWATSLTSNSSSGGGGTSGASNSAVSSGASTPGYSTPVPFKSMFRPVSTSQTTCSNTFTNTTATSTSTTTATGTSANTPTIESMLSPAPGSPTFEKLGNNNNSSNGTSSNKPSIPANSSTTDTTLNNTSVPGTPSSSSSTQSQSQPQQAFKHSDTEIGNRVLTLATEALEMLDSIISIVDETLAKAEVWCDRFGRVGISTGSVPNKTAEQEYQQQNQNVDGQQALGDNTSSNDGQSKSTSLNDTNMLRQRNIPNQAYGTEDVEMKSP